MQGDTKPAFTPNERTMSAVSKNMPCVPAAMHDGHVTKCLHEALVLEL